MQSSTSVTVSRNDDALPQPANIRPSRADERDVSQTPRAAPQPSDDQRLGQSESAKENIPPVTPKSTSVQELQVCGSGKDTGRRTGFSSIFFVKRQLEPKPPTENNQKNDNAPSPDGTKSNSSSEVSGNSELQHKQHANRGNKATDKRRRRKEGLEPISRTRQCERHSSPGHTPPSLDEPWWARYRMGLTFAHHFLEFKWS